MVRAPAKIVASLFEELLSPEEYLAFEAGQEIRHELVAGKVFAMAGETRRDNEIALNLASVLRFHLRGKPCRVYMENVKARAQWEGLDLFYYPDVMVACDARDKDPLFIRYPKLLIEVISKSSRSTDTRDKLITYIGMNSVEEYAMVEQSKPQVTVVRRKEAWVPDITKGMEGTVQLKSVGLEITMRDIYGGLP